MKNLIVLLSLFVVITCNAQIELEVNKEGGYRVKENLPEWDFSQITAEPEAIGYIKSFAKAIDNPGVPVLVEKSEKTLKLKPVFKKLVEVKESFIVFEKENDYISFFSNTKPKEESSYIILFSIASIILMLISNILFKRDNKGFTFIVFTALAAFAALLALPAFIAAAFAAAVFTILLIATAFAAAAFGSLTAFADFIGFTVFINKHYKVASIIFYIFMITHIVLLFI